MGKRNEVSRFKFVYHNELWINKAHQSNGAWLICSGVYNIGKVYITPVPFNTSIYNHCKFLFIFS